MPLINGKSKKSFETNLKTEIHAGKPQKQALAIAYSQKRKSEKQKKMWDGGEVESDLEGEDEVLENYESHGGHDHEGEYSEDCPECMAKGGKVPFAHALRRRHRK